MKTKPRARRRRWPWIAAAVFLGAVGLAAIVLPRLVDPERYRGRIETALGEATGWEAGLGSIDLSVLQGLALTVSPVKLQAPAGGSSLDVGRVVIRAEILPLLRGELNVRSVVLSEPAITLVRLEQEQGWILPIPPGPSSPPEGSPARRDAPVSVTIDLVRIRNGVLRLEDRSVEPVQSLSMEGLEIDIDPDRGTLRGSGALGGEAVVSARGSFSPLALEFELQPTPLQQALDLARALFPLEFELAPPGSVSLTARLEAAEGEAPFFEAQGQLSAAGFAPGGVLPPATDVRTSFRLTREGSLELQIHEAKVAGGPLQGDVRIDRLDPPGTLVFEGDLADASLGGLLGGMVENAAERLVGPTAIGGRIVVDLAAETLDPSSLEGSLRLGAERLRVSGWDLEQSLAEALRDKLGELAEIAALVDPDVKRALEGSGSEETAESRLLDRVAADVSFDATPWKLPTVELAGGGVVARGAGSFDPLGGILDLRLTAELDEELTERYLARYPQIRPLANERGHLSLPLRMRGPLTRPQVGVELDRMLPDSVTADEPEEVVKGLLKGLIDERLSGKK